MNHGAAHEPAAIAAPWWRSLDPRYSLAARASLWFGATALAFAFVTSWITGAMMRRQLEAQLGFLFETLAFQTTDKLDRVIYQRFSELQLTSALPTFRATDRRSTASECRRLLETLQDTSPDFAWIGLADQSGHVAIAAQGMFEGEAVAQQAWFRASRERPFAGPPREIPALSRASFAPDADGSRFFDLAVPMTDLEGRWSGVLAAHVRWGWADDVRRSVLPDTLRAQRLGITVYTPEGDVLLDSEASGWSRPPDLPPLTSPASLRGTFIERNADGSEYLTGYARSRGHGEFQGLGWLAVVRQPLADAFAPAQRMQTQIQRWGILFSAAAALAAWIVMRRVARAMRKVAATADRIRSGDITSVMPSPHSRDEVGRMFGALGKMVEDFRAKAKTDEVNEQLQDRAESH